MAESDNESGGHSGGGKGGGGAASREQDRFLPIANVSRIMKKSLPANAKISKDAKETVQECVSEFISFVTGEASDKCQREKRKTINGDDLLWAMTTLGFEEYVEPLKLYLQRFREIEGEKTGIAPKDYTATAAAAGSSGMYATGGMMMIGAAQQMFGASAAPVPFQQPHQLTNMNMSMNMGGIKNSNLGGGDHGGGGRHGRI